MTFWEAVALIGVAVLGPGGFSVAVVSSRRTRQVAESVGPKNGRGTVQEQGSVMIDELRSMRVAMQSMADNNSSTVAHLQQHDREIAENEDRLSALEAWQHSLHKDAS